MFREIGSEFSYSIETLIENLYSTNENLNSFLNITEENILYLNTGRSAIKYLVENILEKKYSKILLPSYLCESIIKAISSSNIDIDFYKVDKNLDINIKDIKSKLDRYTCIFIINYFGFEHKKETIKQLNEIRKNNVIIEDCTHSILSKISQLGHYQIASMRKWIGIPDGSIIVSREHNIRSNIDLVYDRFMVNRLLGQLSKNEYIEGKNIEKSKFLNLINDAEKYYDSNFKISRISEISKTILNNQNYNEIIDIRRKNYIYLLENIINLSIIEPIYKDIPDSVCPIGFITKSKERDQLRSYLASNGIYCPVHWEIPEKVSNDYNESFKLSKNILTIPCDQRYTLDDMEYIIKKLKDYEVEING